jgi:hypothetical protein
MLAESAVGNTGVDAVAAFTKRVEPVPLMPLICDPWKTTLPLVELILTPDAA